MALLLQPKKQGRANGVVVEEDGRVNDDGDDAEK